MPETATLAKDSVGDKSSVLSCADRCDKCGAQSYYRVEFKVGYLDFCRHDYMESLDKLQALAVSVIVDILTALKGGDSRSQTLV